MRSSRPFRAIPALAVISLFALVAARSSAPNMAAPPRIAPCEEYTLAGGGASTVLFNGGDGILQPFPPEMSAAACSVHVAGTGWSTAIVRALEWDPAMLAPDPSAIALRVATLNPSAMDFYNSNSVPWVRLSPPIVTQGVTGVADPPHAAIAIETTAQADAFFGIYPLQGYYEPSGDPGMPAASMLSGGGSHGTLTGPHPVLAHAICGGGPDLQALRVVQAVNHAEAALSARPFEVTQRFRVPVAVELRWVEMAVHAAFTPSQPFTAARLMIVDAGPGDVPPAGMPAELVGAPFESYFDFLPSSSSPAPRWGTHLDFDHVQVLMPGHDYWLYVRGGQPYEFGAHTLSGGEGPAFSAGIGPLYSRASGGAGWSRVAGTALSFKLVGLPLAGVDVPRPPAASTAFSVAVSPNPAHGLAQVTWSGAVGPVRLEVLDARGRRVAAGEGGAAGTWPWHVAGRDSRPLPAGVYFIHARDSAGDNVVRQLAIVR